MKVTQIFGLVLLFHLVAVSLILLQPGCQTRQPPPPPEGAERLGGDAAASGRELSGASTYETSDWQAPPPNRQAPTRPAGSADSAGTEPESAPIDPAFNAGLTGDSAGSVLQPILSPSVDLSADGTMADASPPRQSYTVVSGDNLSHIARDFGVTVQAIKDANGLSSSIIRVGQELSIPAPSAPVQNAGRDAAGSETYTVRPGDTLSGIASRHGVTVARLKSANDLSSDRIVVGQELYLPEGGRSPAAGRASGGGNTPSGDSANTYTVKPGDTPGGIAKRFGVNYRELMEINNIASANRMQVGQRLVIPGGGNAPSQPAATPEPAAPRETEQPAQLLPQASQPARIGADPSDVDSALDELDLLESEDLPLMDVEVIEDGQ